VLCGHNGRTALLYHLAVSPRYRRLGVGTRLVDYCFARLAAAKIPRCNIYVYKANRSGNRFWLRSGWKDPGTWKVLQKPVLS
jgi:ribosomal protein S18 acetylase RimI-like enzyme